MKHIAIIPVIISILVTGIFLPYLHGDYDHFAVGISSILQFAAFTSVLLVPIGLIWIALRLIKNNNQSVRHPPLLINMAVTVALLITLAAALGAFASQNRFASIIILALGIYVHAVILKKGRKLKSKKAVGHSSLPYYFTLIPLVVIAIRVGYFEHVKTNSTSFVIQQSELLIQDIEAYKKINGHYPVSLLSTIEDYKPNVSGIARFHYELNGNAYNLYFEQFSDMLGTQEIVMYNKLDEHEMTVHNQDLLRIPNANIIRGYHNVVELPNHWKIFYFD
jgi:hypothetical protein